MDVERHGHSNGWLDATALVYAGDMDCRGKQKAALVLAGAVAKGAFEAGVTSELARRGVVFDRFVGTSAGALNATLAAGGGWALRVRRAEAGRIVARPSLGLDLPESDARTRRALEPPPRGGPRRRGTQGRCRECWAEGSVPESYQAHTRHDGPLRDSIDQKGELKHEDEHEYREAALVDEGRWKEIARIAAASAAFPVLFSPPMLTAPNGVRGACRRWRREQRSAQLRD